MSGVRLLTDAVERSIYVTGYGRVRSLTKARSTQRHKEDLVFENNINARVGEGLDPPEDGEFFIVDWLRNRN
ncbi:MAG: hypothetical protein KAH15_02935, partial [Candidatus Marinimicrobia bacterium]|nr:hypothetical protein [Candidatus Neomarinimicrobiota bacterium]